MICKNRKEKIKMKWNVVFEDYETGKLTLFNVFDDVGFRLDVEEIMKQKYDKKQFLYKLDCTAWFHFGSKIEWELFYYRSPITINAEEIKRIADEYQKRLESGENNLDDFEVKPKKWRKIDVNQQLHVNWDHFTNYVWNESKKEVKS